MLPFSSNSILDSLTYSETTPLLLVLFGIYFSLTFIFPFLIVTFCEANAVFDRLNK